METTTVGSFTVTANGGAAYITESDTPGNLHITYVGAVPGGCKVYYQKSDEPAPIAIPPEGTALQMPPNTEVVLTAVQQGIPSTLCTEQIIVPRTQVQLIFSWPGQNFPSVTAEAQEWPDGTLIGL